MQYKFQWWHAALAILVVIGAWLWTGYNGLVRAKAEVAGAWAQVETSYQRRFDLVPNLVNTVKGAANFEQETLLKVTEARTQWLNAGSREGRINAAQGFEGALARLLVTVESYPQLKGTEAFRDLMTQLEGTENRIAVSRKDYNDRVKEYNQLVSIFPRNIVASIFGFGPEKYFESVAGSDVAPSVKF